MTNCHNCHRADIRRMIEKSLEHIAEQADPLVDMEETIPGELYLHNAYVMAIRCQTKGCSMREEIDLILAADYRRIGATGETEKSEEKKRHENTTIHPNYTSLDDNI